MRLLKNKYLNKHKYMRKVATFSPKDPINNPDRNNSVTFHKAQTMAYTIYSPVSAVFRLTFVQ